MPLQRNWILNLHAGAPERTVPSANCPEKPVWYNGGEIKSRVRESPRDIEAASLDGCELKVGIDGVCRGAVCAATGVSMRSAGHRRAGGTGCERRYM